MSTGFFRMLRSVAQSDFVDYMNSLPYDELIEFDPVEDCYRSLYHVTKKYSLSLTDGTFRELFTHMTEILVHPSDKERFIEFLHPETLNHRLAVSQIPGILGGEFRLKLLSGNWRWAEIIVLKTQNGEGLPYKLYFLDVQNRKNRELGLSDEYFASAENRNEMTGLLKKTAFIRGAKEIISKSGDTWCFVAIDIENFKLFNEWYGHSRGDYLMVQIGAKLLNEKEAVSGLAGYFGQDDFCLLTPYDMDRVNSLYTEIYALITETAGSGGFMPAMGVSVTDGKTTVRDLLDRAFLATRFAKENYHSRIRLFEESMHIKTEEEYRILAEFLTALRNHELTFYLQPQCLSSNGRVVGSEALARWIRADGSTVPPSTFIPILEKHGLVTDLDQFIWKEVCRWLRRIIDKGQKPLPVSLNVSPLDIINLDLADHFEKLITLYELPRDLVKIEITESAYISNAALVAQTVQSLRDKGFIVMMDDFGSGYSSLNMLRSLNVDVIKLDAQFMQMQKSDEIKGIHIIESIVNMTKTLGVPIIVEGVENEEQKRFLEDLGCGYIQGYYFYRPMTKESFEELTSDPNHVDSAGLSFKSNQQFKMREMLDDNVYSDSMLNNILGPCAFYERHGEDLDIVRYNEQFYRAVGVPDFNERLRSIQQYMPPGDVAPLNAMLDAAEEDRLNGAEGVMHFYRTDGSLSSFYMRMYFLHSDDTGEEPKKMYYGAVQDITKLTTLENRMLLLKRYSPDTVLFLRLGPPMTFSVLFNGLEEKLGLDAEQLEKRLNSTSFAETVSPVNNEALKRKVFDKLYAKESFTVVQSFVINGRHIRLVINGDHVSDSIEEIDYILVLKNADAAEEIR